MTCFWRGVKEIIIIIFLFTLFSFLYGVSVSFSIHLVLLFLVLVLVVMCCRVCSFLSSLSHLYYSFFLDLIAVLARSQSERIFVFSLFRGLLSICVVISWAICHRFLLHHLTCTRKELTRIRRARKMEFILIHLPSNECFTSKSLIKSKSSTRWLNHENEKNEHGNNSSSKNSCKILREREKKQNSICICCYEIIRIEHIRRHNSNCVVCTSPTSPV